jgi:hypothetical protein
LGKRKGEERQGGGGTSKCHSIKVTFEHRSGEVREVPQESLRERERALGWELSSAKAPNGVGWGGGDQATWEATGRPGCGSSWWGGAEWEEMRPEEVGTHDLARSVTPTRVRWKSILNPTQ